MRKPLPLALLALILTAGRAAADTGSLADRGYEPAATEKDDSRLPQADASGEQYGPPLPPGWANRVAAAGLGSATPDQPLGNADAVDNFNERQALEQAVADNRRPAAPEVASASPGARARATSSRGDAGLSGPSRVAQVSAPMGAVLDLNKPEDAARLITSFTTLATAEQDLARKQLKVSLETTGAPVGSTHSIPQAPGSHIKTVDGFDPGRKLFDGDQEDATVAPVKKTFEACPPNRASCSKGA